MNDRDRDAPRGAIVLGALAAVLFVVGTVGPPIIGRGVYLAADLVTLAYPWRADTDPTEQGIREHGPVSDTVDSVYPGRNIFYDSLATGDPLDWNPYVVGGRPHGSDSYNGVWGPFALAANVVAPGWYAPALIKVLTMAAAIGFTFLFCRLLAVDRGPSLFAGVAFAGSGFLVMWTNWTQPEVAALIPALFWATERFLQRPRLTTAAPIAVALAGMLAGNFPAVVLYALYVLVLYVCIRCIALRGASIKERSVRLFGSGGAVVAGVALVAATLLPFAFTLANTDTGDRAEHPGNHLPIEALVTSVAPKAFGLSTTGATENRYLGPVNQVEAISYIGIPVALLAAAAFVLPGSRRTPRGARAVLIGATLVLGWATYVGGDILGLLQNLPAFGNSFIGRTRAMLGFTVAVLAGLGLQAVLDRRAPNGRRAWTSAIACGGLILLVTGYVLVRTEEFSRSIGKIDVLRSGLVVPVAAGLATTVIVAVLVIAGRRGNHGVTAWAVAALTFVVVGQGLDLSVPLLPNEERSSLYPTTPAIDFLVEEADGERVAPEGGVLFGSANSVYGIRSATGHAFFAKEWKAAILAIDADAFRSSPTLPLLDGSPGVATSPVLDRLGVSWWLAAPQRTPPGEMTGDRSDGTCATPIDVSGRFEVALPPGDGLRGLVLEVCEPVEEVAHGSRVRADVGRSGGHAVLTDRVEPGPLVVPVPAERETGRSTATLSLSGLERLSVATTSTGAVALDVIRPADDGLELLYAGDVQIYRRLNSLGRVHWAASATFVPEAGDRLAMLQSGVPDDSVVLSEPGERGSGRAATVTVERDDPESIVVDVDASGDGYVVFADSIQEDWSATVDGRTADLVPADHAVAAVHVPAGEHRVEVRYDADGSDAGLAISAATAGVLIIGCAVDVRRRRRSRVAEREAATFGRGPRHGADDHQTNEPRRTASIGDS